MTSQSQNPSLCEAVREMTDEELVTAAEHIRGSAKRGHRRMLTTAEVFALSAILEEQNHRSEGPGNDS